MPPVPIRSSLRYRGATEESGSIYDYRCWMRRRLYEEKPQEALDFPGDAAGADELGGPEGRGRQRRSFLPVRLCSQWLHHRWWHHRRYPDGMLKALEAPHRQFRISPVSLV